MKTCFFVGHRDCPVTIKPLLTDTINKYIKEYGVTNFVTGNYGTFDHLAAATVALAREQYSQVHLTMLIPYHPSQDKNGLPFGFDGSYYPEGLEFIPKPFAIVKANRHMVDYSQYIIAYVNRTTGNSQKLYKYAKRKEAKGLLHAENLADFILTT